MGQVLRLARTSGGPTAAGQCRLLTGFPWLRPEPIGPRICDLRQCPKLSAARLRRVVDTPAAVGESYLSRNN